MVYKDPNVKDGPSYRHLVVVRKKKKKREGSEDEYQKFLPCHICDKVKKKKKLHHIHGTAHLLQRYQTIQLSAELAVVNRAVGLD